MRARFLAVVAAALGAGCNCDPGPVAVTVEPARATVPLVGTRTFNARVTGAGDGRVAWTLSGTGCDGGTCGLLDAAGRYTAPWCLPTPPEVTVTATSLTAPGHAASATVALALGDGPFDGRYAYHFEGFVPAGAVRAIGTFTLDGGQVTGVEDRVTPAGVASGLALTGTASHGCYRRGRLTLNDGLGTPRTFALAFEPGGARARFIQLDATGGRGVGVAARLAEGPLPLPAGDLVLALTGQEPLAAEPRVGLVGRLRLDGAGLLDPDGGALDANLGGTVLPGAPVAGACTVDPATGRGEARLEVGAPLSRTLGLRVQVVSASEAFWLGLDPPRAGVPLLSGRSLARSGEVGSPASVGSLVALDLVGTHPGGGNALAALAALSLDGQGAVAGGTGSVNDDTTVQGGLPASGTYGVDPRGRGQLALRLGSGAAGLQLTLLFHQVSPGRALALLAGTDRQGARVAVGELQPRAAGPWSTASLQGTYLLGTSAMATSYTPLLSGVLVLDGEGGVGSQVDASDIFASHPDRTFLGGTYQLAASGQASFGPTLFTAVSGARALLLDLDPAQHQPTVTVMEREAP